MLDEDPVSAALNFELMLGDRGRQVRQRQFAELVGKRWKFLEDIVGHGLATIIAISDGISNRL